MKTADLNLFQTMETYDWAVRVWPAQPDREVAV